MDRIPYLDVRVLSLAHIIFAIIWLFGQCTAFIFEKLVLGVQGKLYFNLKKNWTKTPVTRLTLISQANKRFKFCRQILQRLFLIWLLIERKQASFDFIG